MQEAVARSQAFCGILLSSRTEWRKWGVMSRDNRRRWIDFGLIFGFGAGLKNLRPLPFQPWLEVLGRRGGEVDFFVGDGVVEGELPGVEE